MEFGVLFTSHPNPAEEPYPHRDVHARTTAEIEEAERLGFDTAWIAEHHFSTNYGIMPDCFAYMAYLAARTTRIGIGAAVITLPLYDPIRVVENTAFVDILSNGRVRLGIGSGYRPYEFEGLGRDFEHRREMVGEQGELGDIRVAEAIGVIGREGQGRPSAMRHRDRQRVIVAPAFRRHLVQHGMVLRGELVEAITHGAAGRRQLIQRTADEGR